MTRIVVRRVIRSFFVFVVASILVFVALRVAPGDPQFVSAATRASHGLDDPAPIQYLDFMADFFTGDLGASFVTGLPIDEVLRTAGTATLKLFIAAIVLTYGFAIPLSFLAIWRRNSALDRGITYAAGLAMGIPNFFLAVLLIQLFAVELRWLPVAGDESFNHLILPAALLAAEQVSINVRMLRSALLEELNQDYVRTLRAKGLSEGRILCVHGVRHALPPVIALVGLTLRTLLAYTFIVEVIFRWPGLGRQLVNAIRDNDFELAHVLALLLVTAVIIFNLLADLVQEAADPRLRERAS